MPIPDYQTVMLPLLRLTVDGSDHRLSEADLPNYRKRTKSSGRGSQAN